MENKTNRVLNERAFADVVGVSYALIKKLRQQGVIKGYCRVGRRILYKSPEHVESFLRQFEQYSKVDNVGTS
jgi:predicted transcriptional regulator